MSLISEVANLMLDSVTVHRFTGVSQQGADSFSAATEVVDPVRITRNVETLYDNAGRQVLTKGKILMSIPPSGPLNYKDKLVDGEGEVFRVLRASRKKDKDGSEYHVVFAT